MSTEKDTKKITKDINIDATNVESVEDLAKLAEEVNLKELTKNLKEGEHICIRLGK